MPINCFLQIITRIALLPPSPDPQRRFSMANLHLPLTPRFQIVPQLITPTEDTSNPDPLPSLEAYYQEKENTLSLKEKLAANCHQITKTKPLLYTESLDAFWNSDQKDVAIFPRHEKKKSAGIKRKDEDRKEKKKKKKLVKISMGLQKRQNCQSKNCRSSRRRKYLYTESLYVVWDSDQKDVAIFPRHEKKRSAGIKRKDEDRKEKEEKEKTGKDFYGFAKATELSKQSEEVEDAST
ncbi:hypothetical protein CDAR_521741 [Caerostris darwini]|uniref:Uncharacterized protein n=1 Tax=Caerostris darwini TaxID=1538125 RepID=A0AAV4MK71_9ARAC|nr:hypothetical protein CDAR_521741 [Caerostris darwini]